jgi:putative ABC transport system permease protein
MNKNILKMTFREIFKSLGRWFAIFAIVALGVGFFSGLKVCKPAFMETGNTYLKEHNFFDYRLISTLGLEEVDVNTINDLEQVKLAEGSYSVDALINIGDTASDITAKFLTISQNINTPNLICGTMPQKSNECLVDGSYFTEADIGKEILIAQSNLEDTSEMLTYDKYIVTGVADSPLYLNFERGSSSIGDGTIACFIMLQEEGFSSDVFTEVYVTLNKGDAFIFSQEYDEISHEAEAPLEKALEECSNRRYDSIVAEASSKVEDGQSELDSKKADLESSKKQLADTEATLNSSQEQLNQGFAQYSQGLSELKEKKESSYANLDLYYQSGMLTEEEYLGKKALLDNEFAAAQLKLDNTLSELNDKQAQLNDGFAKLQEGKEELNDGVAKIDDAQAEIDDAKAEILEIETPSDYVLDRNTNVGYVCFDNDISIVDGIATVFPIFFFLVAALVCMTTMSRMVAEQRTQIGVLKALGYSKRSILSKYILYSASSTLLGGILGFFAGTYIFTWVIWEAYGMMYGFSDVIFVFDWLTGGVALAVALLSAVGTTIYSCYSGLSAVPAELIRPAAPTAGKRIFLERIPAIWNKLKFLQKVSVRNVFLYKKRFFMMILGICGCTALLITGFGVRDSVKNVVSMQYDQIYVIDYDVTFDYGLNLEEQEKFKTETQNYIKDYMFAYSGTVDVRENGMIKSVNIIVPQNPDNINNFIKLHNGDKDLTFPKLGECIINNNLAENLKLSKGDKITVYDSDMNPLTVTIAGLCDNYVYNYIYINEETFASAWGTAEMNTALLIEPDKVESSEKLSAHEIGAKLMDIDKVSSVAITEDFRTRIDSTMQSLDYVIALVILCAASLAFIVLYNLTNINITERIREIATIKVLGFYPSETAQYVFRENLTLTAIAAFVGIIPGTLLHSFVMEKINVDLLSFDIHIAPISYILSIIGTFVFALLINFLMKPKLTKVSMTESLKSIE